MRKELEHFYIGTSYGGNQDWFRTFMMRLGGCGAETACDSSLYLALHRGIRELYPFDADHLTKKEYVDFAHKMEKYLWPRMSGIDRLEIFVDGYGKYLKDAGVNSITIDTLDGGCTADEAFAAIREQIDADLPVPILTLNHSDRDFRDYNWHWFLINGYDLDPVTGRRMVKAVTYSEYNWLDFDRLWNTGYARKGGLILFRAEQM